MSLPVVCLIAFAAIAVVCFAVVMVFRDLFATSGGGGSVLGPLGLRRPLTVADESPSASFTGRIDQAFDRLVLETGLDASSTGAFGMLLVLGLIVGGSLFLWNENPVFATIGVLIGMTGGLVYFMYRRAKRLCEIQEQLPDVLDLMSRAVRAGESLDQAISLIGQEMDGALGYEFQQCARQLDMGMSVAGVMRSLMRRVRMMEVRILATTLTVHRQTGGNLALALERMAGVVRDRLNYKRHMRAATGAGRVSSILIGAAGPVLFLGLFFWQYQYLQTMLTEELGRVLLGTAVVMEIIGLIWVVRMLRTEE